MQVFNCLCLHVYLIIQQVLLLVLYNVNGEGSEDGECITTFQELERSIIGQDANINSMVDAFYPPNRQPSIAANVYYFLDGLQEINRQNPDVSSYDYGFRWSASWVFAVIRPDLLQLLSLFVYHEHTLTIKIVVDPVCGAKLPQSSLGLFDETKTCSEGANSSDLEMLLNKLTTHLKSYILDNRLLGVDEQSLGYSSWFFNRNNSNDHCVIGQSDSYKRFRIFVAAIMIVFPVAVALAAPFLIARCFQKLHEELKNKGSNVRYYFWAVVTTMILFDVAVLGFDTYIIVIEFGKSAFTDIKWYYYLGFSYVFALPIGDFVVTTMLAYGLGTDILKIPIPCPIRCCDCKNSTCIFLINCVWIAAAVLMVQLVCFHSYFIALALFASLVHAIFFLLIYATGMFGLVVLIAILLKAKKTTLTDFILAVIGTAVFILILLLFVAVKELMTVVGVYRNSGGVLSIVGSLAPAMLLPPIAWGGKKVLEMFEVPPKMESEGAQSHTEEVTRYPGHININSGLVQRRLRQDSTETLV